MFACIHVWKLPAALSLTDFAYGFSPVVEEVRPDTAVIDVDGCELLFGSAYQLASEVAARAKKSQAEGGLETTISVAIAANPDAADVAQPAIISNASATPNTQAPATTAASVTKPEPKDDNTRYLLQAGAFQASGDAEAVKAKIAMLGLSARVESAQIADKTVYRVRMGPYGSASELADAKKRLSGGGLPAMAIKAR